MDCASLVRDMPHGAFSHMDRSESSFQASFTLRM